MQAEVESFQKQLDTKTKELDGFENDVAKLQAQVNSLMAEAAGPNTAPKRAGETVQGLHAVKLYLGQDDSALATAEYLRYKTEAEASRQVALCPLRWHLHAEIGLLDETKQGPPAKSTCTTGVAGEQMQEDAIP